MVDPAAARVRVLEELLRHDLLDVERLQRRANRVVPRRAAEHGVRTQARAHLLFAAGRSGPVSKRAGPQCNAKTATSIYKHCLSFQVLLPGRKHTGSMLDFHTPEVRGWRKFVQIPAQHSPNS